MLFMINEIKRPRSRGPICQSRVWSQKELDDTKSYHELIMNMSLSKDLQEGKKLF